LLEAPLKAMPGVVPLSLAQLHDSLQNAIWSEALKGQDASLLRRNVQREHLRRIAVATTRPSDIVLEANDGHSLVLFGPTGCAQTWRTRVVEGIAKHAEQQPAGADVTIIGTWSYPAGTADARAAIRTCVLLEDHQEIPEEHLVS
jgi:hypothetical protein